MAVYYDCLTAVKTVAQGAGLSGIDNANIVIEKLPWVRGVTMPAVIISPIGDTIRWVNNQQIEIGYGVHVVVIDASNQDLTDSHDSFMYWRQQIEDALLSDRLSAVSDVIDLLIEPSGLFIPAAFRQQYDASGFVARCVSRETVSA
jgi:hypothetical protein